MRRIGNGAGIAVQLVEDVDKSAVIIWAGDVVSLHRFDVRR